MRNQPPGVQFFTIISVENGLSGMFLKGESGMFYQYTAPYLAWNSSVLPTVTPLICLLPSSCLHNKNQLEMASNTVEM